MNNLDEFLPPSALENLPESKLRILFNLISMRLSHDDFLLFASQLPTNVPENHNLSLYDNAMRYVRDTPLFFATPREELQANALREEQLNLKKQHISRIINQEHLTEPPQRFTDAEKNNSWLDNEAPRYSETQRLMPTKIPVSEEEIQQQKNRKLNTQRWRLNTRFGPELTLESLIDLLKNCVKNFHADYLYTKLEQIFQNNHDLLLNPQLTFFDFLDLLFPWQPQNGVINPHNDIWRCLIEKFYPDWKTLFFEPDQVKKLGLLALNKNNYKEAFRKLYLYAYKEGDTNDDLISEKFGPDMNTKLRNLLEQTYQKWQKDNEITDIQRDKMDRFQRLKVLISVFIQDKEYNMNITSPPTIVKIIQFLNEKMGFNFYLQDKYITKWRFEYEEDNQRVTNDNLLEKFNDPNRNTDHPIKLIFVIEDIDRHRELQEQELEQREKQELRKIQERNIKRQKLNLPGMGSTLTNLIYDRLPEDDQQHLMNAFENEPELMEMDEPEPMEMDEPMEDEYDEPMGQRKRGRRLFDDESPEKKHKGGWVPNNVETRNGVPNNKRLFF